MNETEITQDQWKEAQRHFEKHMQIYKDLLDEPGVNTGLALAFVFEPIAKRFAGGERTRELYEEMMGVD